MSDTEVRVTTPAHAAGVVDVTISGPPGSNTLAQGYSYGNVPASAEDTYAVPFNAPLQVPAPGVLENDNSNGAGTMVAAVVTDVTSGTSDAERRRQLHLHAGYWVLRSTVFLLSRDQ